MPTKTATFKSVSFLRAFKEHPASVGETYFEHLCFASVFSGKLFFAAFAAIVHAFIPALFEKTASGIITSMYERIQKRATPHSQN